MSETSMDAQATSPQALFEASGVKAVLEQLDAELVGLVPVKSRIRDIAALPRWRCAWPKCSSSSATCAAATWWR
jgi:hypothetical protein